jgi:hypothetical protein
VLVIKSRRMRWARHVVRLGEERGVYKVVVGNPRERDPGVNWRIILRRFFRKWDVGVWTGMGWLRIERGGGQL